MCLVKHGPSLIDYFKGADIICLQETWSTTSIQLDGCFTLFSPALKTNLFGRPSGGLATYISYRSMLIVTSLPAPLPCFQVTEMRKRTTLKVFVNTQMSHLFIVFTSAKALTPAALESRDYWGETNEKEILKLESNPKQRKV